MPSSARVASANIALRLAHWAAVQPLGVAVIDGRRRLTFGALDDECARLGAGLQACGVGAGTRCALMVPPSVELYALAFALFRIGAVPVLVDPGIGWRHLKTCLDEARPEAFIGSPKAHLGRWLGRWGKASIDKVFVAQGFFPGARGLGALRRPAGGLRAPRQSAGGATAAILFTSGSTGVPKGVVYTHDIFGAQVDALGSMFSIEPGEVSVPTFPLFGLFDVALGMTVVLPRMDSTRPAAVDPRAIVGAVQENGAAQLFGSPALLDRVGRYCEGAGVKLPSLKRAISAGAPVAPKVLARFAALMAPGAEVHTPYGATEALPVATIGSAELSATAATTADGGGVCVGRPVSGVEVFIIPVSDEGLARWRPEFALPPGSVGEIVVTGAVVSALYFERPRETAAAKIPGEGGRFYHRMGDVGYFDDRGRLWFCGRKSQRVELPGATLHTVCCEGVFNAHPGVRRSALVGARVAGVSIPVLCVELEDPRADRARLRQELLDLAQRRELTRRIATVLFHPGFPVDIRHNAKISRETLAVWAAGKIA